MTKLFLVRHGQDKDNAKSVLNGRRNAELTDYGKGQAKTVASKLKGKGIEVIYSSTLRRAHQTAKIIAQELDIGKVLLNKDFIERDFGILTGKPDTIIPKYSNKLLTTESVVYFLEAEGAESFPKLSNRCKSALSNILNKHPAKNFLIVSHGDIGKMIRAAYYGWDWEKGLKTPYFSHTDVIDLSERKKASI